MTLHIRRFEELTTGELYEILRLRSEIFIVEQQAIYQDLDGIDYRSLHLFLLDDDGNMAACLRLFEKEDEPGTVQIGRVVTRIHGQGLGTQLMQAALDTAKSEFHARQLYLTGRKSALNFYLHCGFHTASEEHFTGDGSYFEFRRSV